MSRIASVAQLEAPYGQPAAAATVKEVAYKVGGETYGREWPGRAAKTMW